MKLQVLVATMNQHDFSKVESMNIKTDVLFANQTNETSFKQKKFDFGIAKMISTETKGVGCNRNIALLYSEGDYILFSDDDLCYTDGYEKLVLEAFENRPNADGFIFNIKPCDESTQRRSANTIKRLHWFNSLNYGTVRLVVKRKALLRENVMFNINFGGGTNFSAGEDSIFINDILKKGLKLYSYPKTIATLNEDSESTWFKGFTPKYYYDKGILAKRLFKKCSLFFCLQDLIRHPDYKSSNMKFIDALKYNMRGIHAYSNLVPFDGDI